MGNRRQNFLFYWENLDRKTVATIILGGILFFIPLFRIWEAWGEHDVIEKKVADLRQAEIIPLNAALINKEEVELPQKIKNLFMTSISGPPKTVEPPRPLKAETSAFSSLDDLVGRFRSQITQNISSIKLPEPPKFDQTRIRLRGFFRKNRIEKAVVLFDGKLLLLVPGERIGKEVVVENCDFNREEITIRLIQSGILQKLSVER